MSVEKFRISKDESEYSIIPNAVAQGLNYCLEALGLYLYIFSLPPDWEFHKKHLQQVCNIGEKKLNRLLKILENHNLLHIQPMRNACGQFTYSDMRVKNGKHFKNIEITTKSPSGNFCRTAKAVRRQSRTTKEIDKKKIEIKREKGARQETLAPLPDDFVFDDENQKLAIQTGERVGLSTKELLDKFKAFVKDRDRKSADWNAAYRKFLIDEKPRANNFAINKPKETNTHYRFWEPGNPDYDRVNA